MHKIPLTNLKNGQKGKVILIDGCSNFDKKLESLGIRPGATIVKKSGLFGRGPVIVSIGTGEAAIGYGMAKKIIVEVDR